MEYNIINLLTSYVSTAYDEAKNTAEAFVSFSRNYDQAHCEIQNGFIKVVGAVEFANRLCCENGYPEIGKEILGKWNTVWETWFLDLEKEYK